MRNVRCGLLVIMLSLLCISVVFAEDEPQKQKWQTIGNAVLRSEPNLNGGVISYIKQGIIVEELEQTAKWIKVKTPSGKTGWINKSLLVPVSENDSCKGVQGFSALCPINSQKKQIQGAEIPINQKINAMVQGNVAGAENKEPEVKPITTKIDKEKIAGVSPTKTVPEGIPPTNSPNNMQPNIQPPLTPQALVSGESLQNAEPEPVESFKTSYIVDPETVTAVKMSSSDINRIVCPVDIKDVVYSEEKGLQVKISGKNAFVKFLIKRIGTKEEYSKIPSDIYVVCGDKVYSIIAFPQRQPATTVYLQDKGQKVKGVIEKYSGMPIEKRIVELVRSFSKDTPPEEAEFYPQKKEYKLYENLRIIEKGKYVIPGEGMQVRIIDITAVSLPKDTKFVEVTEKDFLRAEITQTPLALSLDKLRLYKGDTARLLVIEKSKEEE